MQHIDSVVVVGSFRPEKVIPAQVLDGERLQRLGAHSVADAIRYFSGVQIKDYGGIGGLKTINVRGMGTQHVGVFYDGIQLGNAQNGQIDLGRYSLDNMAAVTLYNGQKSSGVQSAKDYASASAVYLRTRTPEFRDGKRRNLKLTLKGGSFGTVNPSVLYEQRLGERISNSLNAEFLYTTGRYKFSYVKADGYDTTAVRQNGDVRALRIEEGLFGRIPNGNWRVKAYFYDSERGYPGAFVREEPGKFRHEDRQWDSNFFLQGSFFKSFGDRHRLSVNAKYAYDYLHYLSDPRLDVTTMYVNNHYYQQEVYLSAAHELALFKWWDLNLATDLQYNTLAADLVNFVYPSRLTSLTALAATFRFGKATVQGSLLYTFVKDFAREPGAEAGEKNVFTPTLVAQYKPFRETDFALRAFYKRIFRMPTLNDLYYTFIGNKYLKPEYTTQYNLGIAYTKEWLKARFRRFEVSLDAYYNEVDDKIIAMPTSNQFQWTMVNLGYVKIRGADAVVSGSMCFGRFSIDCRATYTWQKAQDFTDRSSTYYGGQIPYIPWHSGSAIAGLSLGDWSLDYSFIYTGERYESSANIPENQALAWYTSDLALSKNFRLRSSQLRATLEVNNLFNQQYEVVQCYPMPGTNVKIIVSWIL
ncbi:TonB-dependent receptor [uncultured Alistipes sp.]|uniref:TonB-dependent receptor n=1 Tax=uncultured Alistipes sp. TaxID=538949 RepID=UPI0026251093|nr:TonB-dependent receptor [uncultured Alistipes sp.]